MSGFWHRSAQHVRNRIISGLLVLVPLGVTIVLLRLAFRLVTGVLNPIAGSLLVGVHPGVVALASGATLLLLVYLTGLFAGRVAGRRFIALTESVVAKLPLVKSIYASAKQVVEAFSVSRKGAFRSVVLVEWPAPGIRSVGLVSGTILDGDGIECLKVFIPTAPNPTTGFLQIVRKDRVIETSMELDEALRLVISAGVLSPESLGSQSKTPTSAAELPKT